MFRDEKLEMKVGLFIGVGIFLMFMIVFSISDLTFLQKGYEIGIVFDFVNGLTEDAPVRLAGVDVGEVETLDVFYDEEAKRTRVHVVAKIRRDTRIEEDAVARVNTLGLLGEQYLEITPGTAAKRLKNGDVVTGRNPVNVGMQMENMSNLAESVSDVFSQISQGRGTLGKLIMDDTIYNDIQIIFERLRKGEGTIGKLLVKEKVYDDLEYFVEDIKAHPWKLLSKPRRSSRDDDEEESRGTVVEPR